MNNYEKIIREKSLIFKIHERPQSIFLHKQVQMLTPQLDLFRLKTLFP